MFEPLAAYVAGLSKEGVIVKAECLSDPSIRPTFVVEFEFDGEPYQAIYHENKEMWEFPRWLGDDNSSDKIPDGLTVKAGALLFDCCEKALAAFNDVFAAQSGTIWQRILANKMAREINDELDADFLRSFNACVTVTCVKPAAEPMRLLRDVSEGVHPVLDNRKLKARWVKDMADDANMMPIVSKIYKWLP